MWLVLYRDGLMFFKAGGSLKMDTLSSELLTSWVKTGHLHWPLLPCYTHNFWMLTLVSPSVGRIPFKANLCQHSLWFPPLVTGTPIPLICWEKWVKLLPKGSIHCVATGHLSFLRSELLISSYHSGKIFLEYSWKTHNNMNIETNIEIASEITAAFDFKNKTQWLGWISVNCNLSDLFLIPNKEIGQHLEFRWSRSFLFVLQNMPPILKCVSGSL